MNNKEKTRKKHPRRGKASLDNLWAKQEIISKIRKIFRTGDRNKVAMLKSIWFISSVIVFSSFISHNSQFFQTTLLLEYSPKPRIPMWALLSLPFY